MKADIVFNLKIAKFKCGVRELGEYSEGEKNE